jgi:hypothetical protein
MEGKAVNIAVTEGRVLCIRREADIDPDDFLKKK